MTSEYQDLTVCVCTRNRADDLSRALSSVIEHLPRAPIVVSDDSDDDQAALTARSLAEGSDLVSWVRGPQAGLSANRNRALREVTTPYVLFLDDDAEITAGFGPAWRSAGTNLPNTILSGVELQSGGMVRASATTFLGHQKRPYAPEVLRDTIVINATVFPTELFARASFDEKLQYGYEEVDIARQAVAHGYRIAEEQSMQVVHRKSPSGREDQIAKAEVSRIYVALKHTRGGRFGWTKTLSFGLLSILHLMLHRARLSGPRGVVEAAQIWLSALRQL